MSTTQLNSEQKKALAKLREPFPADSIGKLPKPFKSDSPKGKCKPKNQGGDAPNFQDHFCGGWHGLPAAHLDYVGHADLTHRLLDVDPLWTWEPVAFNENGTPQIITRGNTASMWIKLTVAGMTRLGVGTCASNKPDAEKELIGDALRNASMRFGAALDLWSKSERAASASHDDQPAEPAPSPAPIESVVNMTNMTDRLKREAPHKVDELAIYWKKIVTPGTPSTEIPSATAKALEVKINDLIAEAKLADEPAVEEETGKGLEPNVDNPVAGLKKTLESTEAPEGWETN